MEEVARETITCVNDGCKDGFILVHNAYNTNPLVGVKEPCDLCNGTGYIRNVFYIDSYDDSSYR